MYSYLPLSDLSVNILYLYMNIDMSVRHGWQVYMTVDMFTHKSNMFTHKSNMFMDKSDIFMRKCNMFRQVRYIYRQK
jgi:hypothetical protein